MIFIVFSTVIFLPFFQYRFLAYVAYKKENAAKSAESSKYFEYRGSEDEINKFEYIDDWGEKYVGLVSLSLNILDTTTGDITTVNGIDEKIWTVGQPVFLPLLKNDEIEIDNGSEKKNSERTVQPSYRLAYTGWKNGPRKLGMIYCYQRESSIFVVDVTDQITTQITVSDNNTESVKSTEIISTENMSTENVSTVLKKEKIMSHINVTPKIQLARSARFSPNGRKMVFLGSKKGFPSHSGCSEILEVNVEDIIECLDLKKSQNDDKKEENTVKNEIMNTNSNEKDITVNTIIDTVFLPKLNSNLFPGIYTDQLPRNCFLNDNLIIMTSPWGSVETIITVELNTKKVQKIDPPKGLIGCQIIKNFDQLSCVILDINKIKDINGIKQKQNDELCSNNILLSISSPSSSPIIAILNIKINKSDNKSDKNENNEKNNVVTSLYTPLNYTPDRMPITRRKPAKKIPAEQKPVDSARKPAENNPAESIKNLELLNDFNSLLDWKISKYFDENGIPYESILITPKIKINNKNTINENSENKNINNDNKNNENDSKNENNNENKCPLIVVPHGGPHSCTTSSYFASYAFLSLYLGASVLHVNYRGSTGFGQDSINSLLGE